MREACCEACGSDDVGRLDMIPGIAKIHGMHDDGTLEWTGDTMLLWDDQAPDSDPAMFACGDCGHIADAMHMTKETSCGQP